MAGQDHLQIDVKRQQDMEILRLSGELDLASAPLLQREIDSAGLGATAMILDLEKLDFIDSTGLRMILAAHERAKERGQEFAVTRGSRQVQRLLAITGVGEHLRIIASADDMLV